jgi:hypothetical protein
MKPDISAYQFAIRAAIEENGWEMAPTDELDAWWCHEAWQLRSVWAPRGFQVYLTFLIDPQSSAVQLERGEYRVWAVKASTESPMQWQDSDFDLTVAFSRKWQSRLPELISHIALLRDRSNKLLQATCETHAPEQ